MLDKLTFWVQFYVFYFFDSIIIVTGPSFKRETFISAPKTPVLMTGICFLHSSTKYSYKGIATSGLAASIKEGRFPLKINSSYRFHQKKLSSLQLF